MVDRHTLVVAEHALQENEWSYTLIPKGRRAVRVLVRDLELDRFAGDFTITFRHDNPSVSEVVNRVVKAEEAFFKLPPPGLMREGNAYAYPMRSGG